MPETIAEKLSGSSLKEVVLQTVASNDLDQIPPDFDDQARFVICAVRAVARRADHCALCVFVYSEAPLPEGQPIGFARIAHMQDGHGTISGMTILTSRDANNGACRALADATVVDLMNELETLGFDTRIAVIWDGAARSATVYPEGIANETKHIRFLVPQSDADLTQDDVCAVLNAAYDDNLKNPSGHTVKLWSKGKLTSNAEDEIERHLKGQIALYFAGRARAIRVLSQTNLTAGRTDLMFLQKQPAGAPSLTGIVELKVLRGPLSADRSATTEGLSQGYNYMNDVEVPFATLALYDVSEAPTGDPEPLLAGQNADHVAAVRVRRFPIFDSPKAWRDAGSPTAAIE